MTILSLNKTRRLTGAFCAHFLLMRMVLFIRIIFYIEVYPMRNRSKFRYWTHAAIIAALYAVLTHLQNLILPGSASWAIQCRLSEALCVLALFTPAAIPGLTVGCLVFNMTSAAVLPLDFLVGSAATVLAAAGMWFSRRFLIFSCPLPALVMPAVTNAFLVGWELTVYIGGGFWLNAWYVALGELIVMLIFGNLLYQVMKQRHLDKLLFE
jgi:uncharacterized membrane protein